MARDLDQLIDAAGRRMLAEAPPMPTQLEHALRSRRRTIVIRRTSVVAACLVLAIGGIWGILTLRISRAVLPPNHAAESPTIITSTPANEAEEAQPPTLGSFRAATRQGTEGAERATDRLQPSMPADVARPFRDREMPDLHR